jgi:hypothetical protein
VSESERFKAKINIEDGILNVLVQIPLDGSDSFRTVAEENQFIYPEEPEEQSRAVTRLVELAELDRRMAYHVQSNMTILLYQVLKKRFQAPNIPVSIICDHEHLAELDLGPWLIQASDKDLVSLANKRWVSRQGDKSADIIEWALDHSGIYPEVSSAIWDLPEDELLSEKYININLGQYWDSESKAKGPYPMVTIMEWMSKNRFELFKEFVEKNLFPEGFQDRAKEILLKIEPSWMPKIRNKRGKS